MGLVEIVAHIEQAQLDPDSRQVCLTLVDALSAIDPKAGKFLPYSAFRDIVGDAAGDRALWSSLTYLSTFEHAILNAHGYILSDVGEIIPLDDDDFFEFSLSGVLVHPVTGDIVDNARGKVYPYFSLSTAELTK
jgi:hypothetical protein